MTQAIEALACYDTVVEALACYDTVVEALTCYDTGYWGIGLL